MRYYEFKKKQQDEFDKLPMKAAFGDKQFEEMMAEWGLTTSEEDLKKIKGLAPGCFCLKKRLSIIYRFSQPAHQGNG